MVRENPHIVDEFFHHRVGALLKTVMGQYGLQLDYHWFRIEYQKRGAAHAHGCFKIKGMPSIAGLSTEVLNGRIAQRQLQIHSQLKPGVGFPQLSTEFDEWMSTEENPDGPLEPLGQDEVDELEDLIEKGIKAERVVLNFNDWLISALNVTDPLPEDAEADQRAESTKFKQGPVDPHPAAVNFLEVLSKRPRQQEEQYCQLVGAVQRHACLAYCLRNKKIAGCAELCQVCRFDYPFDLNLESRLVIKQYKSKDQVKHSTNLEGSRNDRWVTTHAPYI